MSRNVGSETCTASTDCILGCIGYNPIVDIQRVLVVNHYGVVTFGCLSHSRVETVRKRRPLCKVKSLVTRADDIMMSIIGEK